MVKILSIIWTLLRLFQAIQSSTSNGNEVLLHRIECDPTEAKLWSEVNSQALIFSQMLSNQQKLRENIVICYESDEMYFNEGEINIDINFGENIENKHPITMIFCLITNDNVCQKYSSIMTKYFKHTTYKFLNKKAQPGKIKVWYIIHSEDYNEATNNDLTFYMKDMSQTRIDIHSREKRYLVRSDPQIKNLPTQAKADKTDGSSTNSVTSATSATSPMSISSTSSSTESSSPNSESTTTTTTTTTTTSPTSSTSKSSTSSSTESSSPNSESTTTTTLPTSLTSKSSTSSSTESSSPNSESTTTTTTTTTSPTSPTSKSSTSLATESSSPNSESTTTSPSSSTESSSPNSESTTSPSSSTSMLPDLPVVPGSSCTNEVSLIFIIFSLLLSYFNVLNL